MWRRADSKTNDANAGVELDWRRVNCISAKLTPESQATPALLVPAPDKQKIKTSCFEIKTCFFLTKTCFVFLFKFLECWLWRRRCAEITLKIDMTPKLLRRYGTAVFFDATTRTGLSNSWRCADANAGEKPASTVTPTPTAMIIFVQNVSWTLLNYSWVIKMFVERRNWKRNKANTKKTYLESKIRWPDWDKKVKDDQG